MKKAFTLAEIMIVLSVVGILTAILLPVAFHSAPDENIMKFKKANNTLGIAIRELVNSDKYYANGDLGIKPDGTLVDDTTSENKKYFCKTLADIMAVKKVNCSDVKTAAVYYSPDPAYMPEEGGSSPVFLDTVCKDYADAGEEIVTTDGIVYYSTCPAYTFGITKSWVHGYGTGADRRTFADYKDSDGFIALYKVMCIDVDGIGKGEDPFGYGIRTDGKIIPGARANEWINKSVQKND